MTPKEEEERGPFKLTRATESDFPQITALQYSTFTSPLVQAAFMGPDSPDNRIALQGRMAECARSEPGYYWVKVEDEVAVPGLLVAGSCWKIHPGPVVEGRCQGLGKGQGKGQGKEKEKAAGETPWLDGLADAEFVEKVRSVRRRIGEIKVRYMMQSHLELHICFTKPEYQRRGIGSMMLEWGCRLADSMWLPMWVHASSDGSMLYRKWGFKEIEETNEGELEGTLMFRPASTEPVYGGRLFCIG